MRLFYARIVCIGMGLFQLLLGTLFWGLWLRDEQKFILLPISLAIALPSVITASFPWVIGAPRVRAIFKIVGLIIGGVAIVGLFFPLLQPPAGWQFPVLSTALVLASFATEMLLVGGLRIIRPLELN
ncbi:MAG TPA: hypothetical protein VH593_34390 [Ktedonobacteraceae bacterium]|jgi:hypothetical protein